MILWKCSHVFKKADVPVVMNRVYYCSHTTEPPEMFRKRYRPHSQLLSHTSQFYWHVVSTTPTHLNTPHFTVYLGGNNHGGWVDFAVRIISEEVSTYKDNFDDIYNHQVLNFSAIAQTDVPLRRYSSLHWLLWLDADLKHKHKVHLDLKLETSSDSEGRDKYEWVDTLVWTGSPHLSPVKNIFCVSIPGEFYNGTITKASGKLYIYSISAKVLSW